MHLQLLHTPALHLVDGRVLPLPANDAALLAVLAIDGPTTRETMAGLLWPDAPDEGARVNLRQRLSRWKTRVGLVLQHSGTHLLVLPPPPVATAATTDAATLTHDLHGLAERLQTDPAAASGELLGNLAYDDNPHLSQWVQRARAQWRSGVTNILADMAEQLEREHRIAQALPYAQRITQDDPLAEHAHRRVMRLHYLRGDRSAALAAYDRLRTLLRDELGTVPSLETLALGRLIESGGAGAARAPAARPVALLRPPQLIGRSSELAQALDAWAGGIHLLVSGEAGIGKSRFIEDLAGRLNIALRTRARQGDAGVPYALLARLLHAARPGAEPAAGLPSWATAEIARIVPAFGTPAGGALVALRVAEAARLAIGVGTALCIDDLQYADTATLELLPTIAAPPLQCLLAVRSENVPLAVDAWAGEGGDKPVRTIRLGPLDASGVEALLESLALPFVDSLRWSTVLLQHTAGHPLFLLETVRELLRSGGALGLQLGADGTALRLPLPAEVTRLIERRFDALSPLSLKLLRLAALSGQDYTADMAAKVLGINPLALAEPWSELVAANLFGELGFVHDLAQEVAARSVPAAVAVALHRALAAALEQGGDAAAARIAAHWLQAQQWPKAALQFERAAKAARSTGRPAEELAFLGQAAHCFERAGDRTSQFRVRVAAVEPAITAESIARATARAQDLLDDAVDDDERLEALLMHAMCNSTSVNNDSRAAEQAVSLARQFGDPRRELLATSYLSIALARTGDAAGAMAVYEAHAALAKDTPSGLQRNYEVVGVYAALLQADGRLAEALREHQQAGRLSEFAGDLTNAIIHYTNAGVCQFHLGTVAAAAETGTYALALWAQQGEPAGLVGASTLMNAGNFFAECGQSSRAIDCLQRALQVFQSQRASAWISSAENILAKIYLRLGQPGRAQQLLTLSTTAGLVPLLHGRRLALCCRLALRGNAALPAAWLSELHDIAANASPVERMPMLLVHAAASNAEEALSIFENLVTTTELSRPPLALSCRLLAADALRRLHRHAEALAMARSTTDDANLTIVPTDIEPGERWWLLYQVFQSAHATTEADQALRCGVAAIEAELPGIPGAFGDSFLRRNPFNCKLMDAARTRFAR